MHKIREWSQHTIAIVMAIQSQSLLASAPVSHCRQSCCSNFDNFWHYVCESNASCLLVDRVDAQSSQSSTMPLYCYVQWRQVPFGVLMLPGQLSYMTVRISPVHLPGRECALHSCGQNNHMSAYPGVGACPGLYSIYRTWSLNPLAWFVASN